MLAAGVADTMEAMTASLTYMLLRQVLQMLTQIARRPAVGSGRPTLLAPRSSDAEDFFA
jgi:hypothetical protein